MRTQGRLTEWNASRGFGFITPLAGASKVFVHVTEFPAGDRRPLVNDLVTYDVSSDERGRSRAVQVLHLTPVRSVTSKPSSRPALSRRFGGFKTPALIPFLAVALVVVAALMVPAMSAWDSPRPTNASQGGSGDSAIASAFENQRHDVQVMGQGTVVRTLPDDTDGGRHQRFIIELASGHTLLVAHNIDIASRVPSLEKGAAVSFSGVYEWNAEGGVIHWTHHDPAGLHPPGWLDVDGSRYQ